MKAKRIDSYYCHFIGPIYFCVTWSGHVSRGSESGALISCHIFSPSLSLSLYFFLLFLNHQFKTQQVHIYIGNIGGGGGKCAP